MAALVWPSLGGGWCANSQLGKLPGKCVRTGVLTTPTTGFVGAHAAMYPAPCWTLANLNTEVPLVGTYVVGTLKNRQAHHRVSACDDAAWEFERLATCRNLAFLDE